jgi:hypothetical protein
MLILFFSTRGKWNGLALESQGEVLRGGGYKGDDRGDAEKELARIERQRKRKATHQAGKDHETHRGLVMSSDNPTKSPAAPAPGPAERPTLPEDHGDVMAKWIASRCDPESPPWRAAAGWLRWRQSSAGPARRETTPSGEWMPIEMAPKDGTEIDVWLGDEEFPQRIPDVSWRKHHHSCAFEYCDACPPRRDLLAWREPYASEVITPTHWMPIPPPPSAVPAPSPDPTPAHQWVMDALGRQYCQRCYATLHCGGKAEPCQEQPAVPAPSPDPTPAHDWCFDAGCLPCRQRLARESLLTRQPKQPAVARAAGDEAWALVRRMAERIVYRVNGDKRHRLTADVENDYREARRLAAAGAAKTGGDR